MTYLNLHSQFLTKCVFFFLHIITFKKILIQFNILNRNQYIHTWITLVLTGNHHIILSIQIGVGTWSTRYRTTWMPNAGYQSVWSQCCFLPYQSSSLLSRPSDKNWQWGWGDDDCSDTWVCATHLGNLDWISCCSLWPDPSQDVPGI